MLWYLFHTKGIDTIRSWFVPLTLALWVLSRSTCGSHWWTPINVQALSVATVGHFLTLRPFQPVHCICRMSRLLLPAALYWHLNELPLPGSLLDGCMVRGPQFHCFPMVMFGQSHSGITYNLTALDCFFSVSRKNRLFLWTLLPLPPHRNNQFLQLLPWDIWRGKVRK